MKTKSKPPLTAELIGGRLAAALAAEGMSQMELSRQSGVPKEMINRYLKGRDMPLLLTLGRLLAPLGLKYGDLLDA